MFLKVLLELKLSHVAQGFLDSPVAVLALYFGCMHGGVGPRTYHQIIITWLLVAILLIKHQGLRRVVNIQRHRVRTHADLLVNRGVTAPIVNVTTGARVSVLGKAFAVGASKTGFGLNLGDGELVEGLQRFILEQSLHVLLGILSRGVVKAVGNILHMLSLATSRRSCSKRPGLLVCTNSFV